MSKRPHSTVEEKGGEWRKSELGRNLLNGGTGSGGESDGRNAHTGNFLLLNSETSASFHSEDQPTSANSLILIGIADF